MLKRRIATALGAAAITALPLGLASGASASAASPTLPTVLHVGQIDRQDIAPQPNSEPDTTAEPDIAVSPVDPNIAVAVAQDGRNLTGGAITTTYSWTHDGGASWHHRPLPGVAKIQGGQYDGGSDPAVTFGPDGTAYVSTLLLSNACPNAIGVSKSTDGGMTFSDPQVVDSDPDCDNNHGDDKETIAVDTSPHSPYYGRVYVFWTSLQLQTATLPAGSPQYVRWSDNNGANWSPKVRVTAPSFFVQGAQPMFSPNGTLTISYFDYGTGSDSDVVRVGVHPTIRPAAGTAPVIYKLRARTSYDGGRTWTLAVSISNHIGYGTGDVRCCIPASTSDPVTGMMHAVWNGVDPAKVYISSSPDGRHWSTPHRVNRDDSANLSHVNSEVTAYNGNVYVSYGTRDGSKAGGRYVQQQVSTSRNNGATFGPALSLGPRSDLTYAAIGSGKPFPGDYVGSSATRGRTYFAWCVSSKPADPNATYHQVVYGAVLHP
ncbi:MAG: sialidase family protein [Mycobacteriales bacterium]|nr:MAG: hypothetical protein DLM56_03980 [Pseudonocardiales bacterium]